ncbi:hypothetical protein LEP1GSC060_3506 [Leptospira weilii serovar Ranarum str. ICFT]|uniref:Uncharacterized protein n=1 Tax=Leptospira weilii serovar Ranarum str. ICFT TaxID=1218598 RepID=N1WHB3_9LEPT|nr:hypothetical protein LEP1GSC060_3506 [Leptospira weilii serovar Ranarum str. ICFT]
MTFDQNDIVFLAQIPTGAQSRDSTSQDCDFHITFLKLDSLKENIGFFSFEVKIILE